MGEFDYINWMRQRTALHPWVALGPGDDCAVLRTTPGADWLVTTDMLLEGSHFVLAEHGPQRIGRKAMAVNLSDIAAMGGKPVAAFVSVGLPRQGTRQLAEKLYLAMRTLADEFDTAIAGGDTNTWSGGLVIAQVERVAEAGTLNPRQVKIPGILVDAVVVSKPENHWQTFGTQYNPAFSSEIRVRATSLPPLPMNERNLAGWIDDPQAHKPGAKMPPAGLDTEHLQALVAYLEGLK